MWRCAQSSIVVAIGRLGGRGHELTRLFPVAIILSAILNQWQLKEMAATLAYAVWFLCVCSLANVFPVDCAHFMGGIIRWRPVNPAAFDGTVRIY